MNEASRQQALRALDSARPYLARLDVTGHPEDVAADLIEGWSAVCTALRSLMGGSALDGQKLVRELRQREILSLDTANALLEFVAARDRAQRTTYRPSGADVTVARDAFHRLETELRETAAASTSGAVPGLSGATISAPQPQRGGVRGAVPLEPSADETLVLAAPRPAPARGGLVRNPLFLALLGVLALAGGYFAYATFGPPAAPRNVAARGVELYRTGRRTEALAEFERVARENPQLALPHVYMARIAREGGDYEGANRELQQAIRLEPGNALAMREMGQYLLAAGNPELARNFLIRAVAADSSDEAANGWLACALARNGQGEVGERFLRRAGPGDWTACVNAPLNAMPPAPPAAAGFSPAPGTAAAPRP